MCLRYRLQQITSCVLRLFLSSALDGDEMNPYARETIISALYYIVRGADEIVTLLRGAAIIPEPTLRPCARQIHICAVSSERHPFHYVRADNLCSGGGSDASLFGAYHTPSLLSLLSPLSLRFCTIRYYMRPDKSVERDLMLSRAHRTKEPKDD
jgi:hypothetical protein